MGAKLPGMHLEAVGIVRNGIKQPPGYGFGWEKVVSEVVVDSSLAEALDGLEGFSHIVVLYWMHQVVASKLSLKIHPMGKSELPLVGLFATRSPYRPNPVGQTVVRLLERRGNILVVEGLDAIDSTPVVDIKPYIPHGDTAVSAKVPAWITGK